MTQVHYERRDRVAVLTIDAPPVNALSQGLRQGLVDAVARLEADEEAQAGVLIGAGRLFVGGADISEFGRPPQSPLLPDVLAAIEGASKPIVAALHGAALGGGLEVALACHARIAAPGTKLGLPEVTLGLIPGAGGTQRTPRLVGVEAAIELATSGRPIGPERAAEIGLVDAVASGDLREAAVAHAETLIGRPIRRTGARDMPAFDPAIFETTRTALAGRRRGEAAPFAALDAIEAATRLPLAEGLAEERRLFLEMMETPQRAALIHAFFLEKAVSKLPELDGVAPREVDHVGIVGGGTMGAGIATAALLAGLTVTLVERDDAAAEKARAAIAKNLDGAVKRGRMDEAGRDAALAALDARTGYDALVEADLVIEAVFESMEVKREVFAALDAACRPGAVLATNTSYLDIDAIAAATSRPADVIGLHFFSPAHVMKLLEVVVAKETAPDVVATGFALARRLGKVAVRAGVCDGFIGNRILSRVRGAADAMVLAGASPFAVDRVLVDYGLAMGPYAVADLAGLDIGYMTRQRKGRVEGEPYPEWADELHRLGRLGRKTGRGYYIYDEESPAGRPDPEVEAMIEGIRAAQGVTSRTFTDDEIAESLRRGHDRRGRADRRGGHRPPPARRRRRAPPRLRLPALAGRADASGRRDRARRLARSAGGLCGGRRAGLQGSRVPHRTPRGVGRALR